MLFNSKGSEEITYDAIVVGSGISGGWAAKELTEKGLNVLMLERGRMLKHPDYPTAMLEPWDVDNRGRLTEAEWEDYQKQRRTGYTVSQFTKHLWVKDTEHPYSETKPFNWIRGYHLGGRSIMWGRQSYRHSEIDFSANAREGVAVDWPIRYKDVSPWYDYVEQYIGVSGQNVGHPQTPDGKFQPPMELNCVEDHLRESIAKNFDDRLLMIGRVAHITKEGGHNGRGVCQYRNRCIRGCPYGAYFSSNASTIPAAEATGNLTIRPHSIVHSVIHDKETQKAKGVQVIDAETMQSYEFNAKVVFLCASAVGTTSILMNSKSDRYPNGLGNDSGELGHNLMDHHFQSGARASVDGWEDMYYKGRRANGVFIPRFRNLDRKTARKDFLRGYGYQGGAGRGTWVMPREARMGKNFKEEAIMPGKWGMNLMGFGETLPYHENKMTLDYENTDKWGLPTVNFDVEWKENELAMRKDMATSAAEMLEAAGFKDVTTYDNMQSHPGNGIHEMGTARMGRDPKTSVLNKWNQVHTCKNVFVTDGACMTSAANQNPSLTYMALTARAADYAVSELKKGNI
ncbi:MAG: GMC family oxidoreductase [Bacteroidota bacterium]